MSRRACWLALFATVGVAVPSLAYAVLGEYAPSTQELELNRKKLEEIRRHPAQFAKLHQEAEAFFALSAERQERILKLDRDLLQESSDTQARLSKAMDRYLAWLRQLSPADRSGFDAEADSKARLAQVRELHNQEWIARRPKAIREQFANLGDATARASFLKQLREGEKKSRLDWTVASRFWDDLVTHNPMPASLTDLSLEVQSYVNGYLDLFLTREERERLRFAEGNWPLFPVTLVAIADRHPPALPGAIGPTKLTDLPAEIQLRLNNAGTTRKTTKSAKGGPVLPSKGPKSSDPATWPRFGGVIAEQASRSYGVGIVLPHELFAYNLKSLTQANQEFVTKTLMPLLSPDEKQRLTKAEGRWPQYPLTLEETAHNHNLRIAWFTLPGGREDWDRYRVASTPKTQSLPAVPQQKLRDFVLYELSPEEFSKLNLSPMDSTSMERLTEAYFKRNDQELRRLRQIDQQKGRKTGPFVPIPFEGEK